MSLCLYGNSTEASLFLTVSSGKQGKPGHNLQLDGLRSQSLVIYVSVFKRNTFICPRKRAHWLSRWYLEHPVALALPGEELTWERGKPSSYSCWLTGGMQPWEALICHLCLRVAFCSQVLGLYVLSVYSGPCTRYLMVACFHHMPSLVMVVAVLAFVFKLSCCDTGNKFLSNNQTIKRCARSKWRTQLYQHRP